MSYNSKDIKALSDIDAIRLRPGMYIGSVENPAHLFQEAFDNAIDESLAGRAKNIKVEVNEKDKLYTVEDDGSGIPMGSMKVEFMGHIFDKQSLELLTSKGHVGGKFGGKSYSISSGLHGVGLKAISALSERFKIETCRVHDDTKKLTVGEIEYSKGKLVDQKYTEVKSRKSYTRVSLKADDTIFTSIDIPRSYIINKCKIASAFGHKVKLEMNGDPYDLGEPTLMSLIEVEDNIKDISKPIELKSQIGEEFSQVCIQYFEDLSTRVKGFTNLLYNSQGGTHTRLFERMIVKAWRRVEGKDSILKDSDFLLGMRSVVACFISNPAFTSQTKERLSVNNSMIQPFMDDLENSLVKWLNKNYEVRDLLLRKFNTFRQKQNELLASKEIRGIVKVAEVKDGKVRRRSLMDGMIECTNPIAGETELFITEGESALGSIKQARDTRIHAGIPLRGKCLNVAGLDLVSVLKNKEMLGIVNAIGAGVGENCDASKSRYGKIIITCFTGDTYVPLVDGTTRTFEELVDMDKRGEDIWIYSVNKDGVMEPSKAENPRITGYVKELVELDFGDNTVIRCTADHRFRLKDGSYKRADELTEDDDVCDLSIHKTEEEYYKFNGKNLGVSHQYIYSLTGDDRKTYEDIHHVDMNHYNNIPTNLVKMSRSSHIKLHSKVRASQGSGIVLYNKDKKRRVELSNLIKSKDPKYSKFCNQHLINNSTPSIREKMNRILSLNNSDERMKYLQTRGRIIKSIASVKFLYNEFTFENYELMKKDYYYDIDFTEKDLEKYGIDPAYIDPKMFRVKRSENPINTSSTRLTMIDNILRSMNEFSSSEFDRVRKVLYKKGISFNNAVKKYYSRDISKMEMRYNEIKK